MRIAITSTGKTLESRVDEVFGRCAYFLIVETGGGKISKTEAVENTGAQRAGGAGISAAQTVAEKKAAAVISGNIGPRAMDVLKQFGIGAFIGTGTVKEAVQKFLEKKLERIG